VKVAITGAAGDFGTAILRRLLPDERINEVVAIDLCEPRLDHVKLRPEMCDVRSPRIRALLDDAEAVVHLAFVLVPGRDLAAAHEVNLGGSRNVLEAAAAAGTRRLVVASSLSAYGAPARDLDPVGDGSFPAGTPERFYFREKAQVEHLLDWWEATHPDSGMTITRFRPGFVFGPDFDNQALALMGSPFAVVPDDGGRSQLVHQDDLARAFCEAVVRDAPGPFLLVTEDSVSQEDLAEISGGRVIRVPVRAAEIALDAAHALRLSPVSSEWAVSGDRVGRPGRARPELGWEPAATSRESAYAMLLSRGRPVRYLDGLPRREVLERALGVATGWLRRWSEQVAAMGGLDVDSALDSLQHEFVHHRGVRVHLEVHESGLADPTFVLTHGLGAHARLLTPLAVRLREQGFNVVAVDRPGHGLSEGRRGDCPVDRAVDVIELGIAFARSRFAGPVVLFGHSLGGILTWWALTREPDAEAAVCFTVGHPQVFSSRGVRLKAMAGRAAARLAPMAPVPVKQVADFDHVSLDPHVLPYFESEEDRVFAWRTTARSVGSFVEFTPQLDWSRLAIPALVLSGESDLMVPADYVERVLACSAPPRTTYRKLPDCGHYPIVDHLDSFVPEVVEWAREALAAPSGVGV
jgi:nucleoside-diphosphate-sugar epimerase